VKPSIGNVKICRAHLCLPVPSRTVQGYGWRYGKGKLHADHEVAA